MTRRSPAPRCPACDRSIDAHTREEMLACSAELDVRRCVLCGSDRPSDEVRAHYSRDFRGQQIVVAVCVDGGACIERATSGASL